MKNFNKHTKILIALVLLLGVLDILSPRIRIEAAFGQYFSGRIVSMVPCPDQGGSGVTIIGGKNSGNYYYMSGSARLYKHYQVMPGKKVLGKYVSGGACTQTDPATGTKVILEIDKGTITSIATSLY